MTIVSPYLTQQPRKYTYKPPVLATSVLANISRIPGVSPSRTAPSVTQTISQRYARPTIAPRQQQVTPLEAYKDKLKAKITSTTDYTTKFKELSALKTKNAQRLNALKIKNVQQVQSNKITQKAQNTYAGASPRKTSGGWGGYSNGKIPIQAMVQIGRGQYLRADAAKAFNDLNWAFGQAFGRGISITDSYRTLSSQQRLAVTKPGLAATPGTSNHGWGVALDLGGGINNHGTAQNNWMKQHAGQFGFGPLSGRMGQKEPWHWEYRG